ncbi:hypothetical protein INR49_016712 [Caranx melampygus]|nr:hypothetical protein INR49_016712 [Caranx melampygus]
MCELSSPAQQEAEVLSLPTGRQHSSHSDLTTTTTTGMSAEVPCRHIYRGISPIKARVRKQRIVAGDVSQCRFYVLSDEELRLLHYVQATG